MGAGASALIAVSVMRAGTSAMAANASLMLEFGESLIGEAVLRMCVRSWDLGDS